MSSRSLVAVIAAASLFVLAPSARAVVIGDLDLSFGSDGVGVVLEPLSDIGTRTEAMAVQPDGKIVVAGKYLVSGADRMFAARFEADGDLDPTFGTDGVVVTAIGSGGDSGAYAVVVQPDGAIVLAGNAGGDFGLVRYLSDGTLDGAFGTGGKVVTAVAAGGLTDYASALLLQPDGALIAGGTAALDGSHYGKRFVRYLSDGTLDATFGTGGIATGQDGFFLAGGFITMALQSDGKFIVGGVGLPMRMNAGGTIDTAFGPYGDGRAESPGTPERHGISAWVVLVLPDGRIVTGGEQIASLGFSRWTSTGMVDPTFGPPGDGGLVVHYDVSYLNQTEFDVVRDASGRLLVSLGYSFFAFTENGEFDASFGPYGDGRSTFAIPQLNPGDEADDFNGSFHAAAIQPDGQLVAAGWGHYSPVTGGAQSVLVARFEGGGCSGVAKGSLAVSKLGPPAGDDKLSWKGVAAIGGSIDPAANGIRLVVDDGTFDLTIPGGALWKSSGNPVSSWKYKNKAGVQGITQVQLKRSHKHPDQIAIKVSGKNGDFGAFDYLENVSLVFDYAAPVPVQCATAQWPGAPLSEHDCVHQGAGESVMKCK